MARRSEGASLSDAMERALLLAARLPEWDGVSPVEPVEVTHTPTHSYSRVPGTRGCSAQIAGGKTCRAAKAAFMHHMPTANEVFASGDWKTYQGARKHWMPGLVELLVQSGLPRGLDSVLVEGLCCFPTRGTRDQGNHRGFIEKVIGDALKVGGWIPDDKWAQFEFGNMQQRIVRGERWTRLRLFPNAVMAVEPVEHVQGELL